MLCRFVMSFSLVSKDLTWTTEELLNTEVVRICDIEIFVYIKCYSIWIAQCC